ncbi:ATP-binding protein [Rhizobium leguminosarum]
MLVRDIPLEQAVLDLVDNCIDGAKRLASQNVPVPFENGKVTIDFDADHFRIWDNCGGFGIDTARDYAFRFGRPAGATATPHSIGQFGVGMKRALFKFGRNFRVRSATTTEEWAVDVDVPEWEQEAGWNFPWAAFGDRDTISTSAPGTEIVVTILRPEVAAKFATSNFYNAIVGLIKSKHRQFISDGLEVRVNGTRIDATNLLLLLNNDLKPGVDFMSFFDDKPPKVDVKIIVGVGASLPREAGWYVICNGRVVLEADRRPNTGWGLMEEEVSRIVMPSFHNQFARFRGIVSFDCADSSRVPWNTTKTDVDQDSPVWRQTFERMMEMMRPVITFLNELDKDIDENTRENSPLLDFVSKAPSQPTTTLTQRATFSAPARGAVTKGPKYIKVQYSRLQEDVEFLQDELNLGSAKAVGERTFDIVLSRQRDE